MAAALVDAEGLGASLGAAVAVVAVINAATPASATAMLQHVVLYCCRLGNATRA